MSQTETIWNSRFVDAGGLRTHYLEAGNPAAPPVVLLHGGGAGADATGNWHHTIPQLARTHRVIALDMVGFGRTAKPESFEYSQSGAQPPPRRFLRGAAAQSRCLRRQFDGRRDRARPRRCSDRSSSSGWC